MTTILPEKLRLIAGNSEFTLKRALKYGNGWHSAWHHMVGDEMRVPRIIVTDLKIFVTSPKNN